MDTYAAKQTHPLIIIAAIAVILFCLTGVAALLGWLPHGKAGQETSAPVAVATENAKAPVQIEQTRAQTRAQAAAEVKPAAQAPAAPAATRKRVTPPVAKAEPVAYPTGADHPASPPATLASPGVPPPPQQLAQLPPPPLAEPPRRICPDCGTIDSVREIEKAGEATGIGAVGGAVAGGVIGHQMGGGRGRDVMTVLGAVGGGLAGHQVEKNVRKTKEYQVTVRLEDGSSRQFTFPEVPAWRIGEKVRVVNGVIQPNH